MQLPKHLFTLWLRKKDQAQELIQLMLKMEDEVYIIRQSVRLLEGRVQELEKEFEKSKQKMPVSSMLKQYM